MSSSPKNPTDQTDLSKKVSEAASATTSIRNTEQEEYDAIRERMSLIDKKQESDSLRVLERDRDEQNLKEDILSSKTRMKLVRPLYWFRILSLAVLVVYMLGLPILIILATWLEHKPSMDMAELLIDHPWIFFALSAFVAGPYVVSAVRDMFIHK